MNSLKKVKKLNVEKVFPSHRNLFDHCHKRIDELIDHLHKRLIDPKINVNARRERAIRILKSPKNFISFPFLKAGLQGLYTQ